MNARSARIVDTAVLQVLLLAIFAAEISSGDTVRLRAVDRALGFSSAGISDGELWRLVTPALLHTSPGRFDGIGLQHLVLNSVVLWIVGPSLSSFVASPMWWATVVAGALGGFGAVWLIGTDMTGFGGSSAVTWALLTSTLVLWVWCGDGARRLGRLRFALVPCMMWLVAIQPLQVATEGLGEPQIVHAGSALAGAVVGLTAVRGVRSREAIQQEKDHEGGQGLRDGGQGESPIGGAH